MTFFQKEKKRKKKEICVVLFRVPTQKCQLGMGFILTKESVIVQESSEQSSNKGILCLRRLHYGWVLRAMEHRSPSVRRDCECSSPLRTAVE